ncbi:hypothetical protein OE88DRAFT_1687641 [Heliocybe sulcata]|uniref:Exoribonuclease phosphorolytic domain-containing protein n=1 Tax=Heliocybe sulcata TaxID=5364 RepID=A0A5C3MNG4_9AGAM|nr:hypothetical protein OE88DRAFT_1687641 [Heliocybe sulcata]
MGDRADGRTAEQLRKLSIVYEGLDRADGSARFAFGPTTPTLTSVSGPIEPRPQSEHPSLATLEIHVRPLHSLPSTQSRQLAAVLKSIFSQTILLNQNPRTLIQMVVQALSVSEVVGHSGLGAGTAGVYGPGTIASMVNSASLALINAGSIPLRGVVCAVAVGRLASSSASAPASTSSLILDPSPEEIPNLTAQGVFAFLFSSALSGTSPTSEPPSELIWSNWSSTNLGTAEIDEGLVDELGRAREMAKQGAVEVWRQIRSSVHGMEAGRNASLELAGATEETRGNAGTGHANTEDDEDDEDEDEDDKMEI